MVYLSFDKNNTDYICTDIRVSSDIALLQGMLIMCTLGNNLLNSSNKKDVNSTSSLVNA